MRLYLALIIIAALATGCATDSPTPSRARNVSLQSATVSPHFAEQAPTPQAAVRQVAPPVDVPADLPADLKQRVAKGELTVAQARQFESERKRQRQADQALVQQALEKIRKESREEYAATRPSPIRDALVREELCLGMVDKDVLVCMGPPQRKSRTFTKDGVRESWSYPKLTISFEQGVVSSWQLEE